LETFELDVDVDAIRFKSENGLEGIREQNRDVHRKGEEIVVVTLAVLREPKSSDVEYKLEERYSI
jgi:hypothetical protein